MFFILSGKSLVECRWNKRSH